MASNWLNPHKTEVLWTSSSKRLMQLNPSDLVLNLDSQGSCTVTPTNSARLLEVQLLRICHCGSMLCFPCQFALFLAAMSDQQCKKVTGCWINRHTCTCLRLQSSWLLLQFTGWVTQRCYWQVPTSFYLAMLRRALLCHSTRIVAVRLSVRLRLCLSVMFRYRDHIGWNSSKLISRPNSLRLMRGLTPTWAMWSNGNTPKMGVEWGWGHSGAQKTCNSSETVQDRTKVTMMD